MHRLLAVMGRVVPVVAGAVAASAGCAQIFGLDDTSDTGRTGNSLALTRMSVGATVQTAPLDLSGLRATYLVENPASESGFDRISAVSVGGKWSSTLLVGAPVEFTLPELPAPVPRVLALPSRTLSLLFAELENPGRVPAPEGAVLAVEVDLDTAYVTGERFQVYTVGAWTTRAFAAAELPPPDMGAVKIGPVMYSYSSSVSVPGRPLLDRVTAADAFLILRYAGTALTGVAEATAFDQTATDTVQATIQPVPRDRMLDAKLETMVTTRYAAVRPAVTGLSMSWNLVAAPGYQIGSNAGPVLQSGGLTATDVGLAVAYGNPFAARGWRTIFTLATLESRVFTPTGTTTPATLFAGMNEFIEPSISDELTLPAGLPLVISIDGVPLSTDGQTFPQPTRFVPVTFVSDSPNNTLYELQVYDLVPNEPMTALVHRLAYVITSDRAEFRVPPEVFQLGHHYTLRAISTAGGFPTLAEGNLLNRELPMASSFLDSAVFTVVAP
jgi:hypothetical protein